MDPARRRDFSLRLALESLEGEDHDSILVNELMRGGGGPGIDRPSRRGVIFTVSEFFLST